MRELGKRIIVNSLAITIICLIIFTLNTWWRMKTQYALGEAAFTKGDFAGAIAGYESAIHMYIPFSSMVEMSAQRLWYMGEYFEKEGNYNRALIAYRALRSSFYAAHWLVTPGAGWIEKCDTKIARLVPLNRIK